MNRTVFLATVLLFIACCTNMILLELLIRMDPGSGNLVTFSQFLFIAVEGFIFTAKCGTQEPVIDMGAYVNFVIMFFTSSVCNNYALDFNVPMPLHMIFRSGSLVANMALGIIILKRRYTIMKYTSVIMITAGIILCTFESSKHVGETLHDDENETTIEQDLSWLGVGVFLLTVALFVSARMGIYQEEICIKYGKHPRETLLYTHLLPLPGFLLIIPNIQNHLTIALNTQPMELLPGFAIPISLVYLVLNMVTQRVCVGSVYVLTTECTSLTVTLLVTLRKFLSLIFSVLYFHNTFTITHWFGASLVFIGTLMFAGFFSKKSNIQNPVSEEDTVALLEKTRQSP